ncbi:hypothetical protein B0H14DRAFT_2626035 [Mycena olivaceomarginata]|nr:hypothetical protein B0H14DRAFT_2626035 [Mycena olivaceomarginata]
MLTGNLRWVMLSGRNTSKRTASLMQSFFTLLFGPAPMVYARAGFFLRSSCSASAASQPPNFRHSAAENTVNRQGTGLICGGTQDRPSSACPVPACTRACQRRCALPSAGAAGLPWFFPDCTRHRGRLSQHPQTRHLLLRSLASTPVVVPRAGALRGPPAASSSPASAAISLRAVHRLAPSPPPPQPRAPSCNYSTSALLSQACACAPSRTLNLFIGATALYTARPAPCAPSGKPYCRPLCLTAPIPNALVHTRLPSAQPQPHPSRGFFNALPASAESALDDIADFEKDFYCDSLTYATCEGDDLRRRHDAMPPTFGRRHWYRRQVRGSGGGAVKIGR